MKTDVKINVHMHNKCRHSGGSQYDLARNVLRMIFCLVCNMFYA